MCSMGAWGFGLFQSDGDLDAIADLGAMIDLDLYYPDEPEQVRRELDGGKLLATFKTLRAEGAVYELVLLAAAAMQLGAKLPREYKTLLRRALPTLHSEQVRNDMAAALDEYEDGVPNSRAVGKGLIETAYERIAAAHSESSGASASETA
jgi:hypothetical protein